MSFLQSIKPIKHHLQLSELLLTQKRVDTRDCSKTSFLTLNLRMFLWWSVTQTFAGFSFWRVIRAVSIDDHEGCLRFFIQISMVSVFHKRVFKVIRETNFLRTCPLNWKLVTDLRYVIRTDNLPLCLAQLSWVDVYSTDRLVSYA
jgi:hypothetical protein